MKNLIFSLLFLACFGACDAQPQTFDVPLDKKYTRFKPNTKEAFADIMAKTCAVDDSNYTELLKEFRVIFDDNFGGEGEEFNLRLDPVDSDGDCMLNYSDRESNRSRTVNIKRIEHLLE